MIAWTCIPAEPIGFVMLTMSGNIFLKAEETFSSPSVGGEEWDVYELLNLAVGQKECPPFSKWEVLREGDTIVFEMIDPESKIDWGVPLKLTIARGELREAARTLRLV